MKSFTRWYNYTPCTRPTANCFYVKILKQLESAHCWESIDEIFSAIPGTEKRTYVSWDDGVTRKTFKKWVNWSILTALVKNELVYHLDLSHTPRHTHLYCITDAGARLLFEVEQSTH